MARALRGAEAAEEDGYGCLFEVVEGEVSVSKHLQVVGVAGGGEQDFDDDAGGEVGHDVVRRFGLFNKARDDGFEASDLCSVVGMAAKHGVKGRAGTAEVGAMALKALFEYVLQHHLQALDGGDGGIKRTDKGFCTPDGLNDDADAKFFFGGEVLIEGGLGDADPRRQVVHTHPIEALFGHEFMGRIEDGVFA